jgi:hypothetical protein
MAQNRPHPFSRQAVCVCVCWCATVVQWDGLLQREDSIIIIIIRMFNILSSAPNVAGPKAKGSAMRENTLFKSPARFDDVAATFSGWNKQSNIIVVAGHLLPNHENCKPIRTTAK